MLISTLSLAAEEPPCHPPLPLLPPPHSTEDQQPSPECFQLTEKCPLIADTLPTISSTFYATVPITSSPVEVSSNQHSNLSGATPLDSFDSVPCKVKETELTDSGAVLVMNSQPVTEATAGDVCFNRISDAIEQTSFTEHEETKDEKLQSILSKIQRRKTRFGHIFKTQITGKLVTCTSLVTYTGIHSDELLQSETTVFLIFFLNFL